MTFAGLLASVYGTLCIGGAPRTSFLKELGATPFDIGIISSVSAITIAFQVLAGIWCNRIDRRKPVWMSVSIIQRLLMIAVMASPSLIVGERMRIWWIIGVLFTHDGLSHLVTPMWYSWMADLVPTESISRHWANRQRFVLATSSVASIALIWGFSLFEKQGHDQIIFGFIILCSVGLVSGILDILCFIRVPEPPNERVQLEKLRTILVQPLRDPNYRPFLYFISYWSFSCMLAAPFFQYYMISELKMSSLTTQLIMTASTVGVVVTSRFWGLLADTYGQKPAIQIAIAGKAIIAIGFLLTPNIPVVAGFILAGVMFVDGIGNSGLSLSMLCFQLKFFPKRNRTLYIAATNILATGIVGGSASLIGGYIIKRIGHVSFFDWGYYHFGSYQVVFAVSAAFRLGASQLAARLYEPSCVPVRTVLAHLRHGNPFKVMRHMYRLHDAPSESARAHAARCLGDFKNPIAIKELIRALQDANLTVRHASANALGKIGKADACEALSRALLNPDSGIQSPAARALGLIGGQQSLHTLLTHLRELSAQALDEAIDSLARIGDSAAILPLICLFEEVHDPDTRLKVAAALGRLGDESAEGVLAMFEPAAQIGR